MKGLIVLGSRNPEGRTAMAARSLREGLNDKVSDVKEVFLPTKKIERCRQCDVNGWGICLKQGQCVIKDDFSELVDDIMESDFVVFATPVYFGDLSESIHAFLGRLRRISHKKEKKIISPKPTLGICVAGGGGEGVLSCASNLQNILMECGFNVVEMIPVRRQNLDSKKMTTLKNIGGWLVSIIPPES
jgi:multimeric flavodoxin WrbA